MSSILVRNLGPNNDPLWGQGAGNFVADVNAVAQLVKTRLLLFLGEWWADQADGTPYWQSILGKSGSGSNAAAINLLLTQRILGTPFVSAVLNIQSTFNSSTFVFTFKATVQTQFGVVAVSNYPLPLSQALP